MSENIQKDDLKMAENKKQEFNDKYQSIIGRIENVYNHELFKYTNITHGDLIKNETITSMRSSIETILNIVRREFSTPESDWILSIFSERLKGIESDFNIMGSALKENLKDNKIIKIGYDSDALTFENYFYNMIQKVDHLRYSLDYLFKLNLNLKSDVNKVFLLSNNELVKNLQNAKESLVKEVEDFRKNRAISENAKTEDFYNKAVDKYKILEDKYRDFFYKSIVIVSSTTFLLFLLKSGIQSIWGLSEIEFWFLKLSVLIVGITLITYFLKISTHYQQLADQNYQTQVELQAYPSFMESISTEEAASVRKQLALKYFGREINGATHKDMGNIISDQIKSTTEMVKATTDVLKLKGGNNGG